MDRFVMDNIKVILLDLGGVYFNNGTRKAIQVLQRHYGIDPSITEDIFYGPASFELRKGVITSADYWHLINEKYPILSGIEFKKIWYDAYCPRQSVVEWVKRLRTGYRLGVFSDNILDRVSYLEAKYSFRQYFHFEFYTYNTGFLKTDEALYHRLVPMMEGYQASNREVLLIDDHHANLAVAERMGFRTLLYNPQKTLVCSLKMLA